VLQIVNIIHVAFSYLKYTIQVMRPLERFNLVSCQAAAVDRMMILIFGVYTISVDIGVSLRWLTASLIAR